MTAAADIKTSHPPLGRAVLFRYGFGQLGAQLFRDTPAVLLPVFMTTMLAIPAWIAGIAILLPKLSILVIDPIMGGISDRKKPTWGRGPFLVGGTLATSLGFFLLFQTVDFATPLLSALYISVIFFMTSIGFSGYSVPYLALAAELSDDVHQRTRLLSVRLIFASAGVVVGIGFAQPIVVWLGGGARAWSAMAAAMAAICMLTMLVPLASLSGLRRARPAPASTSLLRGLGLPLHDRAFRALLAISMLQNVAQALGYTVVALIFIFIFRNVALLIPFVLVMATTTIASQPLWLWVSFRFGRLPAYAASSAGWMLVTSSWFFVGTNGPAILSMPWLNGLSEQHLLVLVRAVAIGVSNSGFILMSQAILTDIIAADRGRAGKSGEGAFAGLFSAAEKLSYAIGPAIAGIVRSLTGFAVSKGGVIAQDGRAMLGLLLNFSLLPAGLVAISLVVMARYRPA